MTTSTTSRHRISSRIATVCAALGCVGLGIAAASFAGCAQKECSSNADCASGFVCVYNERCEPDPLDGQNRADGGAADAGAADAGADAGDEELLSCDSNTDRFDADQVYLLGTLGGGDCTRRAVASLDDPNLESVGFTCDATIQSAVIRPADGRLVYRDGATNRILEFEKDEHVYDDSLGGCTYPGDPAANDTPIPTTACDGAGGPTGFLVAADSDDIWYGCGGVWYDGSHDPIPGSDAREPLLRGYGDMNLAAPSGDAGELESPSDLFLVTSAGDEVSINGLPGEGHALTWRAREGIGFWIVVGGTDGEGGEEGEEGEIEVTELQLWTVTTAGAATQDSTFSAMPANVLLNTSGSFALDASGALYVSALDRRQGQNDHAVVKLTPGASGSAEVLYTEAESPEVRMDRADLSTLVTGP